MDELTIEERHRFARELVIVARRWRTRLDERLRELNLSEARWSVLFWLWEAQEGLSQVELAERAGVEAPTLVRLIDLLEGQGLVERRASPIDRRVKQVHLTKAAEPVIVQINAVSDQLRREIMGGITRQELASATDLLTRIRRKLQDGDSPARA